MSKQILGEKIVDAKDAEIARLLEENERLESQIASTADFLNTCLREAGLGIQQIEVKNLKSGIDALYFQSVTLVSRLARAREIVKKRIELWDVYGEVKLGFPYDHLTLQGELDVILVALRALEEAI